MPFIELNFSTYEAALALQKSLNQQLSILRRYSKFLGSVICVRRRRRPPRKWSGKIVYFIHCFILIILSFIFAISVIMEFIQILSSQLSSIKIILFCTRLQSLFAFICVFTWFWNIGDIKLQNSILNSSNGIGIVKHRKRLIGLNQTAVIYGFIRVLLYVSIYTYFQYFDSPIIIFPNIEEIKIDQFLNPIYLVIILFHFIALPIYNSILTYSMLSIMAEFDGLLNDFDNDENISQLPVIRHYLFAHTQIIEVFEQFKTCFSNFLTGCLFLSLIPLSLSFILKGFQDYTILHYIFFGILILDHVIFIAFILILSFKANEKVTDFSYRLLQLASSNTILHEEIPSIVICYNIQIKRNQNNSINIMNIQMFDRKLVIKIIGFFLLLIFLKYV